MVTVESSPGVRPLPAFARLPVLAVAVATSVLIGVNSGRGGYFADELYFVRAGHRPSFGYADQPPLVPLLARLLDDAFPDSLVALRLPMTLLAGVGVVLSALIARELGGGHRAQWLAAAAYPLSPVLLGLSRVLGTYSVDPVLWTLAFWLLVRWIRLDAAGRRDDRPLLWFGLTVAVDVQVKYLVGGMLVVLAVSLLAFGPRRLLTRPMLWLGAAVTVLTMTPGVVWQATHGWPQLAMTRALSYGARLIWEPVWFVPVVVVGAGLPGAFLLCVGLWRLVRAAELRPYRALGWTVLGTTALFVVSGGGFYYALGLVPLCVAAGAVRVERHRPARWWRWVSAVPTCAVLAVLAVLSTVASPSPTLGLSDDWARIARAAAVAYRDLPAGDRAHTAVMGHMYYQAAALEKFGPRYGLPSRAYSANRGYWYFGAPPASTDRVLYVGGERSDLTPTFADVRLVGRTEGTAIWACRDPKKPLPTLWPGLQRTF